MDKGGKADKTRDDRARSEEKTKSRKKGSGSKKTDNKHLPHGDTKTRKQRKPQCPEPEEKDSTKKNRLFNSFMPRHASPPGLDFAQVKKMSTARIRYAVDLGHTLAALMLRMWWDALHFLWEIHEQAASVLAIDHQLAFCFVFLYVFPYLESHMSQWAPPWAATCLWYAFLMQVFCTQGSPVFVQLFRLVLPLVFLTEGYSHENMLMQINGAERLVVATILASFKTKEYNRPVFLTCLAFEILVAVSYGPNMAVQWLIFIVSLLAISNGDPKKGDRGAAGSSTPGFYLGGPTSVAKGLQQNMAENSLLAHDSDHGPTLRRRAKNQSKYGKQKGRKR